MKCCINGVNFITSLLLFTELFKFKIQKCGQILCAHKPYFLMPGHICMHMLAIVLCYNIAMYIRTYIHIRTYLYIQVYVQYSSSVTSHVLASNSRGAREFRVNDSREPCV